MLTKFSEGTISVVSDSYDIYNACSTVWGEQLRSLVSQRNGILVIRPDSGDPTVVVVKVTVDVWMMGLPDVSLAEPMHQLVVVCLFIA